MLTGDGQPLFLDAVGRVVRQRAQLELSGEVGDGPAALEAIERLQPDVALLSLQLPVLGADRVLNAVTRDGLPTRVVVVAEAAAAERAYRALERGAAGCLTREASADQVCEAIVAAARGGVFLGRGLHDGLASEIRLRARHERPLLTQREQQMLRHMAEGLGNRESAERLNVSLPTVKTHVRHLYEKLGASDRAAAVAIAMRRGLLE